MCRCLCLCRCNGITDPELRRFAAEVNGPLMEVLAEKVGYHDKECIDLFRKGAHIVGKLHRTGNGKAHEVTPKKSVHELRAER